MCSYNDKINIVSLFFVSVKVFDFPPRLLFFAAIAWKKTRLFHNTNCYIINSNDFIETRRNISHEHSIAILIQYNAFEYSQSYYINFDINITQNQTNLYYSLFSDVYNSMSNSMFNLFQKLRLIHILFINVRDIYMFGFHDIFEQWAVA